MEQVKDTVRIHPHRAANWRRVRLVAHGVRELANWRRGHGGLLLLLDVLGRALASLAPDPLGDVDAGLGGVAGLAGVEDVVAVLGDSVGTCSLSLIRVQARAIGGPSGLA